MSEAKYFDELSQRAVAARRAGAEVGGLVSFLATGEDPKDLPSKAQEHLDKLNMSTKDIDDLPGDERDALLRERNLAFQVAEVINGNGDLNKLGISDRNRLLALIERGGRDYIRVALATRPQSVPQQPGQSGAGDGEPGSGQPSLYSLSTQGSLYESNVLDLREGEMGMGKEGELTTAEKKRRVRNFVVGSIIDPRRFPASGMDWLGHKDFRTLIGTNLDELMKGGYGSLKKAGQALFDMVDAGPEKAESLTQATPTGPQFRALLSAFEFDLGLKVKKVEGGTKDVVLSPSIADVMDKLTGNYGRLHKPDGEIHLRERVWVAGGEGMEVNKDREGTPSELGVSLRDINTGASKAFPKFDVDPLDANRIVPLEWIMTSHAWDNVDAASGRYWEILFREKGVDPERVLTPVNVTGMPLEDSNFLGPGDFALVDTKGEENRSWQMVVDYCYARTGGIFGAGMDALRVVNQTHLGDPLLEKDQVARAEKTTLLTESYDVINKLDEYIFSRFHRRLYSHYFGRNSKYDPLVVSLNGGSKREMVDLLDPLAQELNKKKKESMVLEGVDFGEEFEIFGMLKERIDWLEDKRGIEGLSEDEARELERKIVELEEWEEERDVMVEEEKDLGKKFDAISILKKRIGRLERKSAVGLSEDEARERSEKKADLEALETKKQKIIKVYMKWFYEKPERSYMNKDDVYITKMIETARASLHLIEDDEERIQALERFSLAEFEVVNSDEEWDKRLGSLVARGNLEARARIEGSTDDELDLTKDVSVRPFVLSLLRKYENDKVLEYYTGLDEEWFKGALGGIIYSSIRSWEHVDVGAHIESVKKQSRYLMAVKKTVELAKEEGKLVVQALDPALMRGVGLDAPVGLRADSLGQYFGQKMAEGVGEGVTGKELLPGEIIREFFKGLAEASVARVKSLSYISPADSKIEAEMRIYMINELISTGLKYHYGTEGRGEMGSKVFPNELLSTDGSLDADEKGIELWLEDMFRRRGYAVVHAEGKTPKVTAYGKHPSYKLDGFIDPDYDAWVQLTPENFDKGAARIGLSLTDSQKEYIFDPLKKYDQRGIEFFRKGVVALVLEGYFRDNRMFTVADQERIKVNLGLMEPRERA